MRERGLVNNNAHSHVSAHEEEATTTTCLELLGHAQGSGERRGRLEEVEEQPEGLRLRRLPRLLRRRLRGGLLLSLAVWVSKGHAEPSGRTHRGDGRTDGPTSLSARR